MRGGRFAFLWQERQTRAWGPEPNASRLGLVDSILLAFAADIVLELGNQRQNAHDELAGARACVNGGIVDSTPLCIRSVYS